MPNTRTAPAPVYWAMVTVITFGAAIAINTFAAPSLPELAAIFYLPPIVIAAAFGGWRWGVLVWFASVAFGWYFATGTAAAQTIVAALSIAGALQLAAALWIRRALGEARARETQRLGVLADGSDARVFVVDTTGRQAMLADTGWTGRGSLDWIDALHPEDRQSSLLDDLSDEPRVGEIRLKDEKGEWRWHRLRAFPVRDSGGDIREWVGTIRDIHEQKLTWERRDLVVGELRHRLKNLLTVIDALAKNSRRPAGIEPGVDTFLQRFLGRLHALGTAGDLVLAGDRVAVETGALVAATLAPFTGETAPRIQFDGPPLRLTEETGAGLGLALHELATNALKYGALSVPEGTVSFTWSVAPTTEGQQVSFLWKERGGPPPQPPAKAGFGLRVIKSVTAREKSGRVEIDYPPDGLACRIAFVKPAAAQDAPTKAAE